MSIADLSRYFTVINPNNGLNPHGNCAHCAVETARALTKGTPPRAVDGSIRGVDGNGVPTMWTFLHTIPNRARVILRYLSFASPAGVYAVETPDHAYNFVVLPDRRVFLIDSNQHIFRQILAVGDFAAQGHNATLEDAYDYDYGDPVELDEESDIDEASDIDRGANMEFFYWGALHPRWHLVLTQGQTRALYTSNGTWLQVQRTAGGAKTID